MKSGRFVLDLDAHSPGGVGGQVPAGAGWMEGLPLRDGVNPPLSEHLCCARHCSEDSLVLTPRAAEAGVDAHRRVSEVSWRCSRTSRITHLGGGARAPACSAASELCSFSPSSQPSHAHCMARASREIGDGNLRQNPGGRTRPRCSGKAGEGRAQPGPGTG